VLNQSQREKPVDTIVKKTGDDAVGPRGGDAHSKALDVQTGRPRKKTADGMLSPKRQRTRVHPMNQGAVY